MFYCSDFNQDISRWDVSRVTDMNYMFGSSKFTQDISGWNTNSLISMDYIFIYSEHYILHGINRILIKIYFFILKN